ncbi:hypothetical protein RSOLAG1IB_02489 [Rhizoctonia solani AG-1 IB]|uniref:Uncharacterized protein n=1 Tax=Thanatephorus cucumeris (strain AG1-IB / isolate 7/3/14) TaxID=1108050 RepID=A0A0B7FJA3_THACB|nr:hypothetical protein RSOLAG1IB_02489 [Rhizoctonia solani AG-1 IB]
MSISLDSSLVLYTLQTLKDDGDSSRGAYHEASPSPKDESLLESLRGLCLGAVSFPALSAIANRLATQSNYVTGIEWRARATGHEYVVLYVSSSPQSPPCAVIRLDRFGKLGIRERWWNRSPWKLTPNNARAATTVLAGPVGHDVVDPSKGDRLQKYQYWSHALPSTELVPNLKRSLENARKNVCTVVNEELRRYESNGLYLHNAKLGRRWADSRGLEYVHADIAYVLAEAMDTGILRCMLQSFCVRLFSPRLVFSSVHKNVQIRQEYARIIEGYRVRLRNIIDSCPELDFETRARLRISWGVEELSESSPLLVQLLNRSLSNQVLVSPYAPIATLSDFASRLDTLYSLMPESGATTLMCRLYARALVGRFPDELWHGYTTPAPPTPVGLMHATWKRAKDSEIFWVFFDIVAQWLIFLALLPVEGISGVWVLVLPFIHAWIQLPLYTKERKFWRRLWGVYDGSPVQTEGEPWHRDDNLSQRSANPLYDAKAAKVLRNAAEISLEVFREH